MSVSNIVKSHLDAANTDASQQVYPPETVARTMLSFVIAVYRKDHELADIRDELIYTIENLDPDTDYEFMQP